MKDTIEARIARQEQLREARRHRAGGLGVVIVPREVPSHQQAAWVEAQREAAASAGNAGGIVILPEKGTRHV